MVGTVYAFLSEKRVMIKRNGKALIYIFHLTADIADREKRVII